jgi:energy-coupling factor transport system ATP-binding protein
MSLILNHVDYVYGAGTVFEQQALKDINLKIKDSEFVGIIGHTGSGKSTLIQLFNGLLQPTSGGVYYNGADINDAYDKRKLRTKVGLVFLSLIHI